jgi:hypothetical protein
MSHTDIEMPFVVAGPDECQLDPRMGGRGDIRRRGGSLPTPTQPLLTFGTSYGLGFSSGTSHRTPIGGSVISAEKPCWCHGIGSASMPPRLPVSVPP